MFIGSSQTLNANASFTSQVVHTERNDFISGVVFTDQTGELFIEQSGDGENWDKRTSVSVTAASGPGEGVSFNEALILPYVRLRFVNGGSNQGAFRIRSHFTSAGNTT